jgi:integrase
MTDRGFTLTDRGIEALPYASSGQYFARDDELRGFAVLVGKRRKTYVVQGDIRARGRRQRSVRIKIGEFGRISTRKARAAAKEILGKITKGIDPRDGETQRADGASETVDPTLRQAWQRYRDVHMKRRGCSESTLESYRDHIERLLLDWLDQPLSVLGHNPSLVTARHDAITNRNGPYMANGCMRSLRAIYNHARKTARTLPAGNPVSSVDWNREERRDTALGLSELSSWFTDLSALENPVRREFHLCLLLSGSRPDALKRAKIEDVDFRRRILHVPKPKGGETKAFDIPLSRAMARCLVRVMRVGRILYPRQSDEWLFPADSASGHLAEHKEDRGILAKWGNELRQTYRTLAQAAGIADLDIHLLMNHSVPGVNAGYITRNKLLSDHLRSRQDAISRKILQAARPKSRDQTAEVTKWPFLHSRRLLKDVLETLESAGNI